MTKRSEGVRGINATSNNDPVRGRTLIEFGATTYRVAYSISLTRGFLAIAWSPRVTTISPPKGLYPQGYDKSTIKRKKGASFSYMTHLLFIYFLTYFFPAIFNIVL